MFLKMNWKSLLYGGGTEWKMEGKASRIALHENLLI